MALKKSKLYSSLWQSCDELRGSMDASQYKDYVLFLLFIKYISDKYANVPYAPITIPNGASFKDMVALKGKPSIGDDINKKIIGPLVNANRQLSQSDFPDFYDPVKLGAGKEMVERLTNLIAIFENPSLDFSKNRADGDDILGDAYEFLMRHFATESGKSKGQFYTPAEVSRVIAQLLGIRETGTTRATTIYDPTCGSGSLLLKVADEAPTEVTLYGQEKDAATSGLARMNMILHNSPTALIMQGNTLSDPKFKEGDALKVFDYVIANPPFSDKRWSTGLDPNNDPHERFKSFGVPPNKQGDYAYLLHIIRSLKSTGKGACILPHGVLYRGNAEADIRRNLVRKKYIKGIIGLPKNLFYGTGIDACIVIIDKKDARQRTGIFMVDASGDFIKEGAKNRLRAQDIHRIVDVFTRQLDIPKYSRMVDYDEIEKHEFNLNLTRYIDSQKTEDTQDIAGHLLGGIPNADVDALNRYWHVCPQLRHVLFRENRPGYVDLAVDKVAIKPSIYDHPEFVRFIENMKAVFGEWAERSVTSLKALQPGFQPKELIVDLSEDLLACYTDKPLIDKYDVYQHLMDYWDETMQDDCYIIASDGWKAETYRIIEMVKSGKKKGQEVDRGWACDLVPKQLIVNRYFLAEQQAIDALEAELETAISELAELAEEHGGGEGALNNVGNKTDAQSAWHEAMLAFWEDSEVATYRQYNTALVEQAVVKQVLEELEVDPRIKTLANARGNITATSINGRLKVANDTDELELLNEYKDKTATLRTAGKQAQELLDEAINRIQHQLQAEPDNEDLADLRIIMTYLDLTEQISELKKAIKVSESALDELAYAKYPTLNKAEVEVLVVDDKWIIKLKAAINGEMDRISQTLTQRVKELAERYQTPLPQMTSRVAEMEAKVNRHLEGMGFSWN